MAKTRPAKHRAMGNPSGWHVVGGLSGCNKLVKNTLKCCPCNVSSAYVGDMK